ncbi:MAG: TVP38/TMEM64 family protein [Alphaproteobacteria bacterium]|nr:TVP38/TMEM64 family protein [Alphaproteobacteria bacterium]
MRNVPDQPVEITSKSSSPFVLKIVLVLALILGLAAFFAFDLNTYVSIDAIKSNRETLSEFVARNGFLAAFLFGALYAVVVAFSLPGGAVMTITGGFLFGWLGGGLIVVVGATIGATALFLIARTAVGGFLEAKAGPFVRKMEDGFRQNALSYLLVLRLIPLFPFWLVNLVPALLGVSTTTYIVATFFGIIPGTFVYASVGNGLGALFDAGADPDLGIIFEPQFLAPLIGLAVLAIIPVLYKKFQKNRNQAPSA